jgi:sterol desaturase/sphingolipid hydroxylase (fatty acid hydroxylase superfamily)
MTFGIVLTFVGGVFTWTFVEYVFHRWLGHDPRFRPNFFSVEHTQHHSQGDYFTPFRVKLAHATLVGCALTVPAGLVGGWAHGAAFVIGLVGAYLGYELVHFWAHVSKGHGPYGRWMRRHHFYHHFENPKVNHGVTSPLWDLVFGTYRPVEAVRVPRRLEMRWLTDPDTGDVWPPLRGTYSVYGR